MKHGNNLDPSSPRFNTIRKFDIRRGADILDGIFFEQHVQRQWFASDGIIFRLVASGAAVENANVFHTNLQQAWLQMMLKTYYAGTPQRKDNRWTKNVRTTFYTKNKNKLRRLFKR